MRGRSYSGNRFMKQALGNLTLDSWDNAKSAFVGRAIHAKISPVESEDSIDSFAVCQVNQRGIGQLRANALVLLYHFGNGAGLCAGQGKKFEKASRLLRK